MHLHVEGKTLYYVKAFNGHKLLEDNTASNIANKVSSNTIILDQSNGVFSVSIVFTFKSKEASALRWHQMLGHASSEVIQHLKKDAEEMKIIDDAASIPRTNQCESCALTKAREIISRKSDNEEYSAASFYRISYDFIQMHLSLNKDQWISHIVCYLIDFNILFTHRIKGEASMLLRKAVNTIENRFNRKIVFIRSNGKKSLKDSFDDLLTEKKITFEVVTSDTQAQNGHAERKGNVLVMKAKALRIEIGLPQHLWHEIIKTSVYLTNKTSMKKHQ